MTYQAVQFQNNSGVSRQQYGGGVVCNGPVMSLSPYYLGTEGKPYDPESYNITHNWGVQMSFMVPLDRKSVDICKKIAERELEKQRLDYELVRIDNCTRFMQRGFTLKPGTDFEILCNDVIPIAVLAAQDKKTQPTKEK